MYLATQALVPHAPESPELNEIPPNIRRLYRREREIASIVYELGLATAAQVQESLQGEISNPAVRSMLNRLVNKGILTRIKSGPTRKFIYGPALTQLSAREIELRRFAEDFYDGSLSRLAMAISELFASQNTSGAKSRSREEQLARSRGAATSLGTKAA